MGSINRANIRKAWLYLKRNGLRGTYYAARERLAEERQPYAYTAPDEAECARQREWSARESVTFSVVVPAYRTPERYLLELIASVREQTYPHWELVIADATEGDSVRDAVRKTAGECLLESADDGPEQAPAPSGSARCGGSARSDGPVWCDGSARSDGPAWSSGPAWRDGRIRYVRLKENGHISRNTNRAVAYASGAYIGLLDHDDLLTKDALFRMAEAVKAGGKPGLLYSDEDKCSGDAKTFYEPHRKEDFNLDLLLANNYICHFLVMESALIRSLGLRSEYNGAQDYDLVLRAAGRLLPEESRIRHVPYILYHWRCHSDSTAENPGSKEYAYEAGRRAVQAFLAENGRVFAGPEGGSAVRPAGEEGAEAKLPEARLRVVHTAHRGFYRVEYPDGPLNARQDLGAVGGRVLSGKRPAGGKVLSGKRPVGGKVLSGKRLIGGRMGEDGSLYYEGLPPFYSGYMHRAALHQDAEALDIRCIEVRPECRELFERAVGVPYRTAEGSGSFDAASLPAGTDYIEVSLRLSRALRQAGFHLLYLPWRQTVWTAETGGPPHTGRPRNED